MNKFSLNGIMPSLANRFKKKAIERAAIGAVKGAAMGGAVGGGVGSMVRGLRNRRKEYQEALD